MFPSRPHFEDPCLANISWLLSLNLKSPSNILTIPFTLDEADGKLSKSSNFKGTPSIIILLPAGNIISPVTCNAPSVLFHFRDSVCDILYWLLPKKLPTTIPPPILKLLRPVPPLLTDKVPAEIFVASKELISLPLPLNLGAFKVPAPLFQYKLLLCSILFIPPYTNCKGFIISIPIPPLITGNIPSVILHVFINVILLPIALIWSHLILPIISNEFSGSVTPIPILP